MPERFRDMVLRDHDWRGDPTKVVVPDYAEEQHRRDMAHEIACPRCGGTGIYEADNCCSRFTGCDGCGGADLDKWVLRESDVPPSAMGTGRVTLGKLVAADRARKEAS